MNYLELKCKKEKLKLSKIILGGSSLGTLVDKELSFEIIDKYIELGGNTIDTARVYCDWLPNGHSVSETTIGEYLKLRGNRKDLNIITKGGFPDLSDMTKSRLSKEDIEYDMNLSLKTLGLDYVDLYFLHRDDKNIPVSEIMDALDELVKSGKTRFIGASNWTVDRIVEANKYATENNKTPFCVSEIQWSLAKCFPSTFDDETLLCMDEEEYKKYLESKIPVFAYTSQAGGVFSYGYKRDFSDVLDKHKKYMNDENKKRYSNLLDLCYAKGCKPSNATVSYLLDNEVNAGAIIGCSSLKQLEDTMSSVDVHLTKTEIKSLLK